MTDLKPTQLTDLVAYVKSLGIDWSFELDGCDSRAQTVTYALSQVMGVKGAVLRLNEGVDIASRFIPWRPEISWGHHTAAIIKVEGRILVLDFALFNEPVELSMWVSKLLPSFIPRSLDHELTLATDLESYGMAEYLFATAKTRAPRLSFMALPEPRTELTMIASDLFKFPFSKKHVSDTGTYIGNPFSLQEIFATAQESTRSLMQTTRCVTGPNGIAECTSYLLIDSQTCYFKFNVDATAAQKFVADSSQELLCW